MRLLKCDKMDPAGPLGGGKESPVVVVDGSSSDQWILELPNPETGSVDVDFAQSFNPVCLDNNDGFNYTSGKLWFPNIYIEPVSNGIAWFWSTSSSDGNTKKVRTYHKVGTAVVVEDVILNGTTPVSGVLNALRPLYSHLLNVSDDTDASNVGTIYHGHGGSTMSDVIGTMPPTYRQIHGDLAFAVSATQDDTVEIANQATDPGLTYFRPNTESTAINTGAIDAGKYRKVWVRHREQPTIPPRGIFYLRPIFKGVHI